MSEIIYIVQSTSYDSENYSTWNEKAFFNKEDAEKFAKELDQIHHRIPDFVTPEFEKAYDECCDSFERDYFPGKRATEEYFKWVIEQDKKQIQHLITEMLKKGFIFTEEMNFEYEEYLSNLYQKYDDCIIEAIEIE